MQQFLRYNLGWNFVLALLILPILGWFVLTPQSTNLAGIAVGSSHREAPITMGSSHREAPITMGSAHWAASLQAV